MLARQAPLFRPIAWKAAMDPSAVTPKSPIQPAARRRVLTTTPSTIELFSKAHSRRTTVFFELGRHRRTTRSQNSRPDHRGGDYFSVAETGAVTWLQVAHGFGSDLAR